MKVEVIPEEKSTSIRKIIADLGPKGVMALAGAMIISWFLLQGNLGAGVFSGSPSAEDPAAHTYESDILRLFESIPEAGVREIFIMTDTVPETQSTVFSNRIGTEREVVREVVILYDGVILRPYEVTRIISAQVGIEFHRIKLTNITDIGGN